MPMYEYKCHQCGTIFELIQRFADEPLKQHPECGGAVERLISRSALVFKGSGFYINDYAKGGSTPANSGESKTGESKSGESKPAAASDSGDSSSKPATATATSDKSGNKGASTTTTTETKK